VKALETELASVNAHIGSQVASKDDLIKQLQEQVALWRNKYEALAKLYSQLRTEHLDMLNKFKRCSSKLTPPKRQ
jgi:huntingtin-interacting protein 1-related protein